MTVGAVLSTGITGRAEPRESSNAESGVEARQRAAWFDASPAVAPPDAQATKSEPSRDVSADRKPSTGAALAATGVVMLVVGAGTRSDSGPKVALGISPGAVNADAGWRF